MEWIYNFEKIREDHNDIADYERLFTFYKSYIIRHNDKHSEIQKILVRCLNLFRNETLISIVYRLLDEINLPLNLNFKTLEKHCCNPSLRDYVLLVLQRTKMSFTEKFIYDLLYDENYESKGLFKCLKNEEKMVLEFLNIKESRLLRKQLVVMLYTEIFGSIEYYLPFIGSNDKSVCFLVYEIVCVMISKKKEVNFLNVQKRMAVENISNFLIFSLPFLKEKHDLMNYIREKKMKNIEDILVMYVRYSSKLTISRNINVYSTEFEIRKPIYFEFEDEGNIDFGFLFDGNNYKSVTDCIEL